MGWDDSCFEIPYAKSATGAENAEQNKELNFVVAFSAFPAIFVISVRCPTGVRSQAAGSTA
jgi:hypothetical protein